MFQFLPDPIFCASTIKGEKAGHAIPAEGEDMIRLRVWRSSVAAGIVALLFVLSLRTLFAATGEPPSGSTASDADIARESVGAPERQAKQPARGVIAAFEDASILDPGAPGVVVVHEQALREVGLRPGKVVMGRLPLGAGRFVTMELEPLRVLGPQTKIVVGGPDPGAPGDVPFPYDTSQVHLLRGKVQGFPDSGVVLFSSPRGIRGHIDLGPNDQRYILSSVDSAGRKLAPGLAMVRPVSRSAETLPDVPLCGLQTTTVVAGCLQIEPPASTIYSKRIKTVEIAVETDFDLYENFNDPTATMDYIVELFARTNAIFLQAIDTRFEVVFVRLFSTAASEKPFMNNADPLVGYADYWNTIEVGIHRDTGTFLSGRRNLPYGGIAYIAGVCTSFGYNVCGYLSGFPDPTRPNAGDYDTGVLAHELGHNFNTYHTPDYCPFIDRCYPPPVFPQRGTLMSYCSQTVSGGNLTEDLWYHRRVRRVMRDFIEAGASCVSYDCNQNGIDDTVDIAGGTPDVNGNGIPDVCEDCQPNGTLDPIDIAGPSDDDNLNDIPDECEPDCNANGKPDDLDIALGTSVDLWGNSVPDECDPDCDGDGTPDYDEIQVDLTLDIDRNVVLDSCQDCDGDGINDIAELQGVRHAWVASDVLNYIGQYHPVSGVRVKTSTVGQVASAQDLIIASGNRVLVTAASTNKVVAYDAVSGAYLSDFVPAGSGGLSYPTGLIIGPDGHLLVCSRNTNNVLKYDGTTGAFIAAFVPAGSGGLTIPFGLTYGPNGNLYVTCGGTEVIEYNGTTGAFIRLFVRLANNGGLSGARGMVFMPNGNLLVASYNTDALIQYNGSTGASMGKWNSGGTASALYLDGPWGLRLGLNGNVFATRDLPSFAFGDLHDDHDHDDVVALHVTSARIMEFDILNGKYTRSFVVGDDTGLRSTTGFAFMPNVFSIDCNENLLQDDCDLASGSSVDTNINGVPDECDPTRPIGDPGGKTRSLTLQVPPSAIAGPGAITALRVKLVDLQNPQPPNLNCCPPPDFSSYESGATCTDPGGCIRWVGKPGTFLESQNNPDLGSYSAARLQCTPLYRDWTADGEFHIIGAEIVPSSTYHVQNVGKSCQGNEAACVVTSGLLVVTTARFGDIAEAFNPPATTDQPDALDIAQLVNKLKIVPGAPIKAISQIQPNLPEPNADINALDIVAVVDALKQFAYYFSGPCPCPSVITCNLTACDTPTPCITVFGAGATCVQTCVGGANDGDPCINNAHCPGGSCGSGFCRDRCGRCTP